MNKVDDNKLILYRRLYDNQFSYAILHLDEDIIVKDMKFEGKDEKQFLKVYYL